MTAKEPIISVSGLRGVIGESLDPILAMRFAMAFASGLEAGPILVTRDGRTTGAMLADAVCSALSAVGRDVLDGSVAATPTAGVLVRRRNCAGGVQISASHNPPQYNGLKLFGPDGRVISASKGEQVIDRFRSTRQLSWTDHTKIGRRTFCENTTKEHLELVLATVDIDRIRKRNFKVVLDSNRGSGSILGNQLLSELGCQVILLGGNPDGQFEHPAEPTAANLTEVARQIRNLRVDVGFCQDPDADRLAIIDELGNYIGEEYTLAITLEHALSQNAGPVVINCATSRMSIDISERHGAKCVQSAVGEANVTDEMIRVGAVYGGEGNGGPIDPRVGYVRDSFVAMAQTLDSMAGQGKTVSQLVSGLPKYGMHKATVNLERDQIPAALAALQAECNDAAVNRLDGLRLDWSDRWLLVRGSNTEPIVRTIAEAPTVEAAKELCRRAATVIDKVH